MKAKKHLNQLGLAFEERDISRENPTAEELERWIALSGLPVKKFFNTSGRLYQSLQLKEKLPTIDVYKRQCQQSARQLGAGDGGPGCGPDPG